jgi:uncharacterized protein (DUF58 family)
MTRRTSPLALSFLSVMGTALFLGLLSGRPELFLVALPLVVSLCRAALASEVPDYTLTYEVSEGRVFEGDTLRMTVTLTARSRVPLLELCESLPPGTELASGCNHALFSLRPGQQVRWSYSLRCLRRGHFHLGTVYARAWERAGLRVVEQQHLAATPVRVYPRSLPLRALPQPRRTQTSVGNYVSPAFGEGLEPGDVRPFAPGDRIKHVNWRASLRLGHLYVTQYQQERNADVVLMLDTLGHAGLSPAGTLDCCTRAAASLAGAYLSRKDRVGLIEYGGVLRWVRPGTGRIQLERVLDALSAAEVVFTYVANDLTLVPPRILPPQALVLALSPLLDARFVAAVKDLAARRFDVVVVWVSPIELSRELLSPSLRDDLACRLWALECEAQLAALRREGLTIMEWHPEQPLELALAPFARSRRPRALAG